MHRIPEILLYRNPLSHKILLAQLTDHEQHGISALVDLFLHQLEYVVIVCARKAFVRGYHDIPNLLVFRLNLRPRIEIRVLYLRCMPDNSGNGPLERIEIGFCIG